MNKNALSKKTEQVDYFKYIFILFLVFIVAVIIWSNIEGKKQDKVFLYDSNLFQNLINSQSDEEGIVTRQLGNLQRKYSDEYLIAYHLGLAYLNEGNMEQALVMYTRTLDLNAFIVENKEFMYQYALILHNNNQNDEAKEVVERAQQLPADEEYKTRLTNLLTVLENN